MARLHVAEGMSLLTPNKKRQKTSKHQVDVFDEAVVRRTVYNFYITEKRVPTVETLRRKLIEDKLSRLQYDIKNNFKETGF
jgi:hypothetical protein